MLRIRWLTIGALVVLGSLIGRAEGAKPIPPEEFDSLYKMIKPQPGESRFWEIDWLIDLAEARRQAAAAGKPILVWSGAGGAPVGVC